MDDNDYAPWRHPVKAVPGKKLRRRRNPADQRLVRTATELFYKRGFQAVGVDELVKTAGVTKATFYRHFASKDDLAAVCLERTIQAELEPLRAIAEGLSGDPAAQLRALVEAVGRRVSEDEFRGWAPENFAVEIVDLSHPANLVVRATMGRVRLVLRRLAEEAAIADPHEFADTLLLLFEGAGVSRQVFAGGGPSARLMQAFERLFASHSGARQL